MKSKMMIAAAVAMAMSPGLGGAEVVRREGWLEPKLSGGKRRTPHPSRVVGKGWAKQGADYKGFFWKQDAAGPLWRLYRRPPGETKITYDRAYDRSILESGWGYVKPTYHEGDIR